MTSELNCLPFRFQGSSVKIIQPSKSGPKFLLFPVQMAKYVPRAIKILWNHGHCSLNCSPFAEQTVFQSVPNGPARCQPNGLPTDWVPWKSLGAVDLLRYWPDAAPSGRAAKGVCVLPWKGYRFGLAEPLAMGYLWPADQSIIGPNKKAPSDSIIWRLDKISPALPQCLGPDLDSSMAEFWQARGEEVGKNGRPVRGTK